MWTVCTTIDRRAGGEHSGRSKAEKQRKTFTETKLSVDSETTTNRINKYTGPYNLSEEVQHLLLF